MAATVTLIDMPAEDCGATDFDRMHDLFLMEGFFRERTWFGRQHCALAGSLSILHAELSPPILRQGNLIAVLEWLARWMRDKYELNTHLKPHGD